MRETSAIGVRFHAVQRVVVDVALWVEAEQADIPGAELMRRFANGLESIAFHVDRIHNR